ncbi:MAG: ATP-binding protein [Burkholderiaceae bacterium]
MKLADGLDKVPFGIRTKLIALFVLIKVLPLILLALLAWEGVSHLGGGLADETDNIAVEVKATVAEMGKTFSKESVKALDDRAREELERLTTDTARAVADFLYARDRDVLLAASLVPEKAQYQAFVANRTRPVVEQGEWVLAPDGKGWEPKQAPDTTAKLATPSNAENRQDFHSRPPETVVRKLQAPLYHEMTFVGLDGKERVKVSLTDVLPKDLRDVSRQENTWSKAETYFEALKKMKPGEVYVSDVIGPYTPSRVIGPVTPAKAESLGIPFEPQKEAYAGRENPNGQRFQGIVRWATPVVKNGAVTGYVTLALDHTHIRSFTDHLMPTPARYTAISDATNGNYAFMWDYLDRSIAHPRHHSIVGFDPQTGQHATPWLEASIHEGWQQSGKPLGEYLAGVKTFDGQTREKKPAGALTKAGSLGLDCRYLNFAPQCQGWHDLTEHGGSGSFLILWTGVWKLTTAAAIPYFTGHYAQTPRGFGYVTIGANVDDFHAPALATSKLMDAKVAEFGERVKTQQAGLRTLISDSMNRTAASLTVSTLVMLAFVVVVAIWLASLLTRRVTDLVAGLSRIEAGDLGFRFKSSSKDELGNLSDSLNKMADSVQASFKQNDEARRQAEDNSRMKSDFVANVSHELRTPLNGILGFSELIREEAPNEELREYADTIHQSGNHLLSVVNDMLDIAKIESGHMTLEPRAFALRPVLDELALLHGAAAQQKGLVLNTLFADDLPDEFHTDPTRLRQVINNLLSNAVKFTDQGEISFSARPQGRHLVVGVRDSGPGIALEAQPLVFERFRQATAFMTREHTGTGLGLALVREFVRLMGGEVRLESVPGQGAYFEFWVPHGGQPTVSLAAPEEGLER